MFHGIKLAVIGRGDRTVLQTDERLFEAHHVLSELQRWFPALQAAVEENDKTWASLAYNIKHVGTTAQEIYHDEHPMQNALDIMTTCTISAARGEPFEEPGHETAQAKQELRAFNEQIRSLQVLKGECLAVLKNKDYYLSKVESIRQAEARRKRSTDRDIDKRVRNEQKLSEANGELLFKSEKLSRELEITLLRKERVLNAVLSAFVSTNHVKFSRNPMASVLAALPPVSPISEDGSSFTTPSSTLTPAAGAWSAHFDMKASVQPTRSPQLMSSTYTGSIEKAMQAQPGRPPSPSFQPIMSRCSEDYSAYGECKTEP